MATTLPEHIFTFPTDELNTGNKCLPTQTSTAINEKLSPTVIARGQSLAKIAKRAKPVERLPEGVTPSAIMNAFKVGGQSAVDAMLDPHTDADRHTRAGV